MRRASQEKLRNSSSFYPCPWKSRRLQRVIQSLYLIHRVLRMLFLCVFQHAVDRCLENRCLNMQRSVMVAKCLRLCQLNLSAGFAAVFKWWSIAVKSFHSASENFGSLVLPSAVIENISTNMFPFDVEYLALTVWLRNCSWCTKCVPKQEWAFYTSIE